MDHLIRILCSVLLGAFAFSSLPAKAEEDRGVWFKSLRQPGTGYSCCDISDCRRTDADWRDGQWWAVVSGEWTPIPADRELEKQSIDGDAYVCSSPTRRIYCFVRPTLGS
jgi:hypothetical protein